MYILVGVVIVSLSLIYYEGILKYVLVQIYISQYMLVLLLAVSFLYTNVLYWISIFFVSRSVLSMKVVGLFNP